MDAKSQNVVVLDHLKKVGPITPLEALRLYGIMRLGARIYDLRGGGHLITTTPVRVKSRNRAKTKVVASYSLAKEAA